MKATDLMIGDKVQSRTGMVVTIVSISHDSPIEYTPIPLTEKILEKNGGKYHTISPNCEFDIHYRYSAEGGVYIEIIETGDEWTPARELFAKELDYVHQLQHALRLCGLDDLANNFQID